MLDAALIEKCADPSLTPAIVRQFVETAGAPDPLAITVKSGGRLILVPKPTTPDEAMAIVREHVGRAVVRVGLTQFPAGVGVKDAAELKPDVVDACENLRMGTKMFAKILRIVAKWYGNPTSKDVLPQIFEDAVFSWKTGEFEGVSVFQAEEPGTSWNMPAESKQDEEHQTSGPQQDGDEDDSLEGATPSAPADEADTGNAGIRVDLSRINGG
ncbi:MAG TPA: TraH family protein [Shinella sp.]|jgi:hypothetical protein|uniref:TraH family protein n=1 Tax=Shinella TaxID=323620 RepID=UPI0007DA6EF3|nr:MULTISPECIES: TraH family protein [Shinella]CAI0341871.1 Conjugal transfer protein TraH [Rhizobiaceae bacterium]CAK7262330.1 Conjugal transfer protein TraH [Shinella sp. WSC3-e]ANH09061.1 conjugal transfer protein TraH [Shinella sp. HZN7]MDC7260323.1 conjugal transfer protein TraH [Shinella sp. YE25]HEV7248105.1 TraH family protein [Shinella sp.]